MSILTKLLGTIRDEWQIGLGSNRVRLINNAGILELRDKDGNLISFNSGKTFKYYDTWTWLVSGEIKVPSGASDQIGSKTLKLISGQTAKIISCIHSIYDGTSVTAKLQKNGADVTGFTSMNVTTTESTTDPTDVSLADGDKLAPVVTGVSGTPHLLKVQMNIEFTITL
jgi:hypothetical protein